MSDEIKPNLFAGASPKLTFIMGVATGVAVVSLIGFVVALATSGGSEGWFKLGQKGDGSKVAAVNNNSGNNNGNQPAPNQPPAKVNVPIKDSDYIRGDQNAPVTLVEYSDLECPFCQRFHPVMEQVMQQYAGKVRWVYRHFPLSFHANAQKEAEASECVGKLGGRDKYWQYIDKIFERTTANGTGFALADLPKLAKEVGVNESKFKTCLDSGEMAAKVQNDIKEGTSYGVSGTPTTFVNGTPVEGAVPFEQIKPIIEAALAGE
ncbi:MAG: DsbA family protein [Patescibacteria group bacterium]